MSKHTLRELGIDPITFEVLRNGLDAIADEMAYTIVRSARSTMIKDCMDYSASLCSANGELIAQALVPDRCTTGDITPLCEVYSSSPVIESLPATLMT